jgi:hypothetical protein
LLSLLPQYLTKEAQMIGTPRVEDAVQRLKGVFLEIPGTALTLETASRLTGLDRDVCLLILDALEDARFIRRRQNGVFVQRTSESPEV